MKKVRVEDVEKSMVLSRDVCGTTGNVLVGRGTTVSPALGRRLKNWGIDFIYIDGEEDSADTETVQAPSLKEVRTTLEKKFAKVKNKPLMKKLFQAVIDYHASRAHAH